MSQLKVGIVGAGVMGRHYGKALREYERARVAAVCDLDLERAAALAGESGATAYGAVGEMLERAELDVVVVATPDFAHREPVLACLRDGKAVLCEKPLATMEEDITAIVEAVERAGRPFMVNFGNRHRPAAVKIREALAEGRVGTPQYVYARLNERLSKTLTIPWLARTSPVWFLMSHCADLVCWLLDDGFAEVHAQSALGAVAEHAPGVPDLTVCLATLKSGCRVVLETAWNLPEGFAPNIDFTVQVIGDAGVVQADLVPHDLKVYDSRAASVDHSFDVTGPRGYGAGWWQESVRYFVDGVLDERPLGPTVHEAAHVSRVLLAVERALASGGSEAVGSAS
jgi:predicted dehydrogenase